MHCDFGLRPLYGIILTAYPQEAKGALLKCTLSVSFFRLVVYGSFRPLLFCRSLGSVLSVGSGVEVSCRNLLFLFGHIIFCTGQVGRYNR